jgi:hypothetical protein
MLEVIVGLRLLLPVMNHISIGIKPVAGIYPGRTRPDIFLFRDGDILFSAQRRRAEENMRLDMRGAFVR